VKNTLQYLLLEISREHYSSHCHWSFCSQMNSVCHFYPPKTPTTIFIRKVLPSSFCQTRRCTRVERILIITTSLSQCYTILSLLKL
jgi:hypothetical protein